MLTVCTCSHSVEQHRSMGFGACNVCICPCFRGAKRIPKSCRWRLLTERELRERDAPLPSVFAIPMGLGISKQLSAAELGLFEEQEKAS